MNEFSYFNRENITKELQSTAFDLLIIGGGITGAGIALDAASRGMKVALIEKNDFASGTSSKSTKLIHGGLRYLKQFDFWLVKEVGTERVIVRSDLCDFTFKNTPSLLREIAKILTKSSENSDYFLTVSQGIFETNIVTSKNLQPFVKEIFEQESLINSVLELASITIKLPKENLDQSGIYYFILKQLAWADIPLQEIISTTNEMTIVVKEHDINQTFAILMDMKLS